MGQLVPLHTKRLRDKQPNNMLGFNIYSMEDLNEY